jgi:hypothetical protein
MIVIKSRIVKEKTSTIGKFKYWRVLSLFGVDVYKSELFYTRESE